MQLINLVNHNGEAGSSKAAFASSLPGKSNSLRSQQIVARIQKAKPPGAEPGACS
jgi:hypothetical protein